MDRLTFVNGTPFESNSGQIIQNPCTAAVDLSSGVIDMSSWEFSSNSINVPSTPLSPSSIFTHEVITGVKFSIIDTILLCCWDNILGPRLQHVWYIENQPQHHRTLLLQVARQALLGDITRNVDSNVTDFKLCDQPDKGLVALAFTFCTQEDSAFTIQALVMLLPNSELEIYLQLNDLVQCCIRRLIAKLKVLISKRKQMDKCLPEMRVWLTDFLQTLSSLNVEDAGIPQQIKLVQTAFHPDHYFEPKFLQLAITSHLVTFGRSVVIGKIPERVNLMIATLAMFNPPGDRVCSRFVREGQKRGYQHDLYIQGILKDPEEKVYLPINELLRSRMPTTIVDIHLGTVTQSPNPQAHILQASHIRALKDELICLQYDVEEIPQDSVQDDRHPESLVGNLMDEVEKLPAECGVREAYIAHFLRLLNRRAASLIKCLQLEMDMDQATARNGLKRLRQDLGLILEGDFLIVLAAAERLQPGIYTFLRGT